MAAPSRSSEADPFGGKLPRDEQRGQREQDHGKAVEVGHRSRSAETPAGREPPGRAAVGGAPLAAEEAPARGERHEHQPPGALGLALAAVVGEEAQVAAHLLDEHRAPVLPGGRSAHVNRLRPREEPDLPPGLAEPIAPVGLLAEHEVALVEAADSVDRLAANEQAGAHQELRLTLRVVVEAACVEGVERARARCELAQEQVLGRDPPDARKAADRALEGAVGVAQARAYDRRVRVRLGEAHQCVQRAGGEPRVRVQEQVPAPRRGPHAGVVAGSEALVLLLDHDGLGEALANEVERAVRGAVVDDDELRSRDALQSLLHPGQGVVRHDDRGDLRHVAAPRGPG